MAGLSPLALLLVGLLIGYFGVPRVRAMLGV